MRDVYPAEAISKAGKNVRKIPKYIAVLEKN